jgi:hypothetical protein
VKKILVAGGGLAGLTVSKLLAKAGFEVTLFEATGRLGGKAGADFEDGDWHEHGYHIFPPWYVNTRPILSELNVPLIDFNRFNYLRAGKQDQPVSVPVPNSLRTMVQALNAGLFPWYEGLLYGYLTIDTLGDKLTEAGLLDQVSRIGLMRSKWYVTDAMPQFEQENLLKASAIPAEDMSAMTVKIVFSNWIRSIHPFLSILPGNLQTTFIEPYAAQVRSLGVTVRLDEPVVSVELKDGRVAALVTKRADGKTARTEADAVVITTPLEVTRKLMDGRLIAADPTLGQFEHLQASPMAALDLTLDHKLPWVPREHVVLHQGRYGLSFIDLSNHWPGLANSRLAFIASNFLQLKDVSRDDQYAALLAEIQQYMSIRPAQVVKRVLRPNVETPLFINTVGAWPNRPDPRSPGVSNLYFAGDWARNPVDLACMEGAISSAIGTAGALAKDFGATAVPGPVMATTYPQIMYRALKWALLPAVVPLWAYAKIREKVMPA